MCLLIGIISHVSDMAHGPLVSIINLNYTVFQSQHDTLSILFLIIDIKRGEHMLPVLILHLFLFLEPPPTLDIKHCLKLFQSDGSAVTQNLSPVRKRVSFIHCYEYFVSVTLL